MNFSPVKKAYDAVALFALLNMAVFTSLLVYLVTAGALDGQKIRLMADVVRGRALVPETPESTVVAKPDATGAARQPLPNAVMSETDQEIMHREADRIKEELRQRLALNNSIMLRATTERETFLREREEEMRVSRAREEARQAEGFEKQVAILQAMQPKIAVDHLLAAADEDEAARMLLAMSTRNAKKIVEAAKTDKQRLKMMTILQRIQEVAPDRTVAMNDAEKGGQP